MIQIQQRPLHSFPAVSVRRAGVKAHIGDPLFRESLGMEDNLQASEVPIPLADDALSASAKGIPYVCVSICVWSEGSLTTLP